MGTLFTVVTKVQVDVLIIAAVYFWSRYFLQGLIQRTFENRDWEALKALPKKSEQRMYIREAILSSPWFSKVILRISERDVDAILKYLEAIFDNQQFCATCENWSRFNVGNATLFCLGNSVEMLSFAAYPTPDGTSLPQHLRIWWLEDYTLTRRNPNLNFLNVVETVIKQRFRETGLLFALPSPSTTLRLSVSEPA